MSAVIYKPGAPHNNTVHVVDVDSAVNSTDKMNTICIRANKIHEDLEAAVSKLQAMHKVWGDDKDVLLCLSPKVLKFHVATLSHVLSSIVDVFFLSKKTRIIVSHNGLDKHSHVERAVRICQKIIDARLLSMTPGNIATPDYMAAKAKEMFKSVPQCEVEIMDHVQLEKKGFGLLLGIGNSARSKPTLVNIHRRGSGSRGGKCVAIVGKGVTFDTGGLAVKPFKYMTDMKFDKIGAVYALYILQYLLEDPQWKHVTFVATIPFAENAVSSDALRPGDVIKSFNGTTVEIENPDAEGRLIMADALGYLEKYKPDLIIDVATLTGHASIISCWHTAYFYTHQDSLKQRVVKHGEANGEHMIPMPSWDTYSSVLKSNVADITNSPRNCSDAIVAALFLKTFVPKKATWIHFDLAHQISNNSTATGGGIRTIIDIIEDYISRRKK
jgi:leucyl aminopeptidase